MTNIFLVSHILLLFQQKSAKYEKLEKYWSYSTRNRAITNVYTFMYIIHGLIFGVYVYNFSHGGKIIY